MHLDTLAHLMKTQSGEEPINVGTGTDIAIVELARPIADVIGFEVRFVFDPAKPDRTPRKLLEVSKLAPLGWYPRIDLKVGIHQTYGW